MLLRGVAVHHTHNTKPVSWHGLWFRDFVGLELQRIDINGPTAVVQRPLRNRAIGVNIEGGRPGGLRSPSVWMKRVLVDNTMGSGIHVENVLNLLMQEVEVYQNLGWGMRFFNCTEVLADRIYAMGGSGMPGAPAAGHGIHFKGCSDVLASNLLSRHSTGDGVLLDGCTDCTFNNINCNHNAGWGWAEINRCDRNIKQGGRFYANGVGSIAQVGNGSAFLNYVPASGVFTSSTIGTARIP